MNIESPVGAGEGVQKLGNKSKRRQAWVYIRDAEGYICGIERKGIGYGRRRKNRRSREIRTKTAVDLEKVKQLRRGRYRARKRKKETATLSRKQSGQRNKCVLKVGKGGQRHERVCCGA